MNLSTTDPAGRTTRYGYYADGILKTLTDANGNITTFERDLQGRPTARVYADGSRETYTYEPSTSRLKSRTDPLGQRTDYAYVRDDRVSAVRAISILSRQLKGTRTVNRASKIENRIRAHQPRMASEVASQGAFQAGKYAAKQATDAAGANPDYNECACGE